MWRFRLPPFRPLAKPTSQDIETCKYDPSVHILWHITARKITTHSPWRLRGYHNAYMRCACLSEFAPHIRHIFQRLLQSLFCTNTPASNYPKTTLTFWHGARKSNRISNMVRAPASSRLGQEVTFQRPSRPHSGPATLASEGSKTSVVRPHGDQKRCSMILCGLLAGLCATRNSYLLSGWHRSITSTSIL